MKTAYIYSGLFSLFSVLFSIQTVAAQDAPAIHPKVVDEGCQNQSSDTSTLKKQYSDYDYDVASTDKNVGVFLFAADKPATYPGGTTAMNEYFAKNIKYPAQAVQNGVDGTVTLNVEIDATGHVSNIKVVNTVGFGTTEEAERLVKNMPAWIPAKRGRLDIPTRVQVPVTFVLQK